MRRRLFDIFGPILLTLALLAGIEVAAGLLLSPVSSGSLRVVGGDDAVSRTLTYLDINLAPLDKDVDLLWRNRPDTEKRQPINPGRWGHHEEWTIRTSSRGLRGPEPDRKSPDTLRILCVGDSVTFGFNVDQSDPFPERLQELLRARFPQRRIEVVNAGTPGWSWVQGVAYLEREGLVLQPDIVIMAHGANDRFFPSTTTDEERIGRLRETDVRWVEKLRSLLERTNTYRLVLRWFAPSPGPEGELTPGCRRQMLETGRCRRVGLDEIEASVSAAHRLVRQAGAAMMVLNLDFMETDAVTAVRRAVQREGIPFLDLVAQHRRRQAEDEAERARRLGLVQAQTSPRRMDGSARRTRVLFRVAVPSGAGSVAVKGRTFSTGEEFRAELSDDGLGGDEVAHDGVWSGWVAVRSDALFYQFLRDDVLELEALPPLPSSQGCRRRDAVGETIFPVEEFGDLFLMAEQMHPNAAGHRVLAESILEALPSIGEFARWADNRTSGLECRTINQGVSCDSRRRSRS